MYHSRDTCRDTYTCQKLPLFPCRIPKNSYLHSCVIILAVKCSFELLIHLQNLSQNPPLFVNTKQKKYIIVLCFKITHFKVLIDVKFQWNLFFHVISYCKNFVWKKKLDITTMYVLILLNVSDILLGILRFRVALQIREFLSSFNFLLTMYMLVKLFLVKTKWLITFKAKKVLKN